MLHRFSIRRIPMTAPANIVGAHLGMALLAAAVVFAGALPGGGREARAQAGDHEAKCSVEIMWKAQISWSAATRALTAPAAPPDVAATLTDVIDEIYSPDWTMDIAALDAVATPEYRTMTGLDCGNRVSTPVAQAPEAVRARLDQVRQVDETTVSAFVMLPDHPIDLEPNAGPASDASSRADGTPDSPEIRFDAVSLVVFVLRDGRWMIDYLSGGAVQFSDVVPKDRSEREAGDTFMQNVRVLYRRGMPEIPSSMMLLATPEATPANHQGHLTGSGQDAAGISARRG